MSERATRLAQELDGSGADLLLVSDLVNVRYLTGYDGSNGLALVGPQTLAFVTDFRYLQQAAEQVDPGFERHQAPVDLFETLGDILPSGELRLGIEAAALSVREHTRLGELLGERVSLVPTAGLVEGLRKVKDAAEIEAIRAASRLADEALREVLESGLVGRTEREVALALEVAMRERGAERPSFETIVASGPHGALPHASPREVRIEAGQLVVIDWGAQLEGYCSDCTRTVATGELDPRAREAYAVTLAAQLAGLEGVAAGRDGKEVDGGARRVIEDAGFGEFFGHGLGHGVGLEVHEAPRLSPRSEDALQVGNVVTVEPGIYLAGDCGVRIEDLVVVGQGGCEILSTLPKELLVLG